MDFGALPKRFKELITPDEKVMFVTMQKRVGFGGSLLDPKLIIVTDKRIIVSRLEEFGLKISSEFISFDNLYNVRLEHGIVSNAIVLTTWARYSAESTQRIDGLRYKDALAIFEYLEDRIMAARAQTKTAQTQVQAQESTFGAYIYCPVCGARNDINAKYCSNCGAKL